MFPTWLSMPIRDCKSCCVSCAKESIGRAKAAAATVNSVHIRNLVRMSVPLEIKVKSEQQFAGIQVRAVRRNSVLMHPVVLVVPGKAGSARHKRVVAVADRISSYISQVRRRRSQRTWAVALLRHSFQLIPPDED